MKLQETKKKKKKKGRKQERHSCQHALGLEVVLVLKVVPSPFFG